MHTRLHLASLDTNLPLLGDNTPLQLTLLCNSPSLTSQFQEKCYSLPKPVTLTLSCRRRKPECNTGRFKSDFWFDFDVFKYLLIMSISLLDNQVWMFGNKKFLKFIKQKYDFPIHKKFLFCQQILFPNTFKWALVNSHVLK